MEFRDELRALLNKYSKENGSNTPDWLLAQYLEDCLHVFDKTTMARTAFYTEMREAPLLSLVNPLN